MAAQIIEIFATGFDFDGEPVSGGTVEVYEGGTSTPAVVWYDAAKTLPSGAGVSTFTLDTQGRKNVYGDDIYKFIVKDSDGVTLATIDGAEFTTVAAAVAALPAATTTAQGLIELATQTEVDTGTDAVRAVTPATLKAAMDAAEVTFRGALVYNTAGATANTQIPFASESYDTDSIHDNAINNARLTVPTGVTKVRVTGQALIASATAAAEVFIYKNGAISYVGFAHNKDRATATAAATTLNVTSPVLSVAAGNYFSLAVNGAAASAESTGNETWFAMEIIE